MKKIFIIAFAIASLQACKKRPTNYVSLSGKIANTTGKTITVKNNDYKKEITLDKNGAFNDTLHIKNPGIYSLIINNKNSGFAYLKKGFEMHLTADDTNFMDTFKYDGKDASTSNFLISQYKFGQTIGNPNELFALEKTAFDKKIASIEKGFDSVEKTYTNIDVDFLKSNTEQNQQLFNYLKSNYAAQHKRAIETAKAMQALQKGKPSPAFKNFENFKGGKTSLKQLKGKYVYIDVWATWCGPCKAEIPYLKSLEKKYHKKNIQFVSISIDNDRTSTTWKKANEKWRKMVAGKNLSGIQLFAGKDISFLQAYQINSIPRFILVDPKGNIVNANALRPSNPKLITALNDLGI